ncbi:hypothetical protein Q1695_014808 [Nippostrongylus brasiliensis]|nr:hypothetical protein Q1695_014808 [Nippostrongylus brasiliensis]
MTELSINALLWCIFGEVCSENGQVSVGLSAAVEDGLPNKERIPVPKNILEARSIWALIWTAAWSTKKYNDINYTSSEPHKAASVDAAWYCGLVAVKQKPKPTDGYEELCSFDFDSECQVTDESVENINDSISNADIALCQPSKKTKGADQSWDYVVDCFEAHMADHRPSFRHHDATRRRH